jgi:hypothetical protein
MNQDSESQGGEDGISTPAGLPRWGPRLAPALMDWHSTSGGKPPFLTLRLPSSIDSR